MKDKNIFKLAKLDVKFYEFNMMPINYLQNMLQNSKQFGPCKGNQ